MTKSVTTKEKLLWHARDQFWSRGYSNVPLRDISKAAGVDVALISRYFGGKMGLFEATLEGAFDWGQLTAGLEGDFIDMISELMTLTPEEYGQVDGLKMIVMNAADPEAGSLVMQLFLEQGLAPLVHMLGGEDKAVNASLFMSTLVGLSMARKTLKLPNMADAPKPEVKAQVAHLLNAALSYQPEKD